MRVIVTITVDGVKETMLEGDSQFFDEEWDKLERKGFGFWLENWRYAGMPGPEHTSRIFVPWGSCLMVETEK